MMKACKGSITVFLSLSFLCIAALLFGIVESARTCGARLYLQVAADSAMESLFSQYHRKLWEDYRILALEYRDDALLQEEFYAFLQPYLNSKDWYPFRVKQEDIVFSEHAGIAEDVHFEEEVLEYMRYGLADALIHFNGKEVDQMDLRMELDTLFTRVEESEEIRALQKKYQLNTKDVEAVEEALAALASCAAYIQEQHARAEAGLSGESEHAFAGAAVEFEHALRELQGAVQDYGKAADKLREKVQALRADFEASRGQLSEEAAQAIEAEVREYEAYVSENGAVRQQIEAMPQLAEQLSAQSEAMRAELSAFEDWVAERLAEQSDEEDYYDYSSEITAFYNRMQESWHAMSLPQLAAEAGKIDRSVKRSLDRIGELLSGDLLELVLPEGVPIPSKTQLNVLSPMFSTETEANALEKLVLGEYAFQCFNFYREKEADPKRPASESQNFELEYLVCGEKSDYKNLSEVVTRLVVLREGMNLIHLFSDTAKRNEAKLFVTQLLCITANPALISVLTFFVLGVWALGQAISDVRTLLNNGRVPLFHTAESWSMSLSQLLQLGESGRLESGQADKGLSYQDYLRVFLFGEGLGAQDEINRRMLVRIQNNIQGTGEKTQPSFLLDQCLYALKASVRSDARHVMYQLGVLRSMADRELEPSYELRLETYYKYRSETH